MSEVAHNAEREFWRPPASAPEAAATQMVEACDRCATEFMVGARFCHVCGATRQAQTTSPVVPSWVRYLTLRHLKQWLGLPTASLIAFFLGVGCALAALVVGWIFSAQTLLDWQAVQVWRIQWLLAAAAAFVAGILLKKPTKQS